MPPIQTVIGGASSWAGAWAGRLDPSLKLSRATALGAAATVGFAAGTLLLLHFITQRFYSFYYDPGSWKIYLPFAGASVVALGFARTRYHEFTGLLRACLRASALGLVVLLAVEAPHYVLGNPEAARAQHYVSSAYPLALAAAVIGVFRPAFVIPAVVYLFSTRHLVEHISGLVMSWLDIRYMLDMALYLSVFGLAVTKIGPRLHPWLGAPARQLEIVGVGMGLHLANYFWSGVAKLFAGPTPWYWIFENQTHTQIPQTIESGILPSAHAPWLAQLSYDVIGFFNVPLNAAIVIAQLAAIICFLRVDWLKAASVVFDLLHIGIYVFGGLFFWPWIWNNVTVWWAARSSKEGLSKRTKAACFATIVIGAPALGVNPAAWLAWFDVAETRQVYFEAVTGDGETIKVPGAFFGSHSYSVQHGMMATHHVPGHYAFTRNASTDSVERNELSGTCPDPSSLKEQSPVETTEQHARRTSQLGLLLRNHHAEMLASEHAVGRGMWYLHVHHHPSNPFVYQDFNRLSLANVEGYNLVIESVCHSLRDGKVEKRVLKRDTEFYNVR